MTIRSVSDRLEWLASEFVTKEGRPFTIEGRPWVHDQLFLPVYGWKLWPRAPGASLCATCAKGAGTIHEFSARLEDYIDAGCKNCPGLAMHKIQMVVINLPRREGKTLNVAGLVIERVENDEHETCIFVAAAGDQTRTLFEENFKIPVENNPDLMESTVLLGEHLSVPEKQSWIEVVETAAGSITGRGRTIIIIEEARDVAERVVSAAAMSMRDQAYQICPNSHRFPIEPRVKRCKICSMRTEPRYGIIVVISSSGVIDSERTQWFPELIQHLEEEPQPDAHLYKRDESENPIVAKASTDMLTRTLGQLPSMAASMGAELNNVFTRKGDDFVPAVALKRIIDKGLLPSEGSDRACLAFLDTSLSRELTSLVILEDDPGLDPHWRRPLDADKLPPWTLVTVTRLDFWKPQDMPGGVIDPDVIQAHLDIFVPRFLGLLELWVDVRVQPWAHQLVDYCNKNRPGWGRRVKRYQHGAKQVQVRNTAWMAFEQRVLNATIRVPQNETLKKEMMGVRKVQGLNGMEVRDRARKKRHADLAEGIASLCGRVFEIQSQKIVNFGAANEERDVNRPKELPPSMARLFGSRKGWGETSF